MSSNNASDRPPEGFILIGHLGKTFQLQGGLRFYGLGEAEAKAISKLREVFVSGHGLLRIERVRPVGKHLILYLAGVAAVETAERLVGLEVHARLTELPDDVDQIYVEALVGLPVYADGEPFGEVAEVQRGAQDLLVVIHQGEKHLLPLEADYVSLREGSVQVKNAPEGLFELHRPVGRQRNPHEKRERSRAFLLTFDLPLLLTFSPHAPGASEDYGCFS